MGDILYCEWLKLRRARIVPAGFLGTLIVPVFVIFGSVKNCILNPDYAVTLFDLYDSAVMFSMLLFAPLVLSVMAAYLIGREYAEKTLKTVFAVPVERGRFLAGKFLMLFILVMAFMLFTWLETVLFAMVCALFFKVEQLTACSVLFFMLKMLKAGALLYVTITPAVYLSIRTKGFAAPFIAVAVVCLVNVVLSGSPAAVYFPWTASYLLARGWMERSGGSAAGGYLMIGLVGAAAVSGSLIRFLREDTG